MTIGGSIALIVIGAILAFAVEFEVSGLNIDVIGYILIIGGIIGLIFGLTAARNATRGRSDVVEERRIYDERDRY